MPCNCGRCCCLRTLKEQIRKKIGSTQASDSAQQKHSRRNDLRTAQWVWKHVMQLVTADKWQMWKSSYWKDGCEPSQPVGQADTVKKLKPVLLELVQEIQHGRKYQWGGYVCETDKGKEYARKDIEDKYHTAAQHRERACVAKEQLEAERCRVAAEEAARKRGQIDKVCMKGIVTADTQEYAEGVLDIDYDNDRATFKVVSMVRADGSESKPNMPYSAVVANLNRKHHRWLDHMMQRLFAKVKQHFQSLEQKQKKIDKGIAF